MDRQQGRRRILAAALIVMVGFAAQSTAQSASAKEAQKIPGYGSKAKFQAYCESLGGTFIEDGLGNTECHYPDGGWTECDANGNDCWYTPQRPAPPMGLPNSDIAGSIVTAPIVDGTDQNTDDDRVKARAKHHKGKAHGRHGKKRGK